MPERERAYYEGSVVTVLDGSIGRARGKTKIRNQFGFVSEVPSKDLASIPSNEPHAKLKFGDDAD